MKEARFGSSYGDIGQPTFASKFNVTGFSWNCEASNDRCVFEVDATINASDGGPAPPFHLINGDLSYRRSITLPSAPFEKLVFGRNLNRRHGHR